MSRDVLQDGLLQGRLPGKKEFSLYYLELTTSQFHIFDGENGEMRKHLHSIKIKSADMSGVETKVRKGEFRFYFSTSREGRYVFKVQTEADRENWIAKFLKVINKESLEKISGFCTPNLNAFNPDNVGSSSPSVGTRFDVPSVPVLPVAATGGGNHSRTLPGRGRISASASSGGQNLSSVLNSSLPPVPGGPPMGSDLPRGPGASPRASIISTDSGIGTSVGGEVCRTPRNHRGGSKSTPNSGSAMFTRGMSGDEGGDSGSSGSGSLSHSADSQFTHRVKVTDEGTPKWFWGTLSRQDCEKRLQSEGETGNFVVRVNATGHYIMSFWRVDGIHHHKILNHEGIWRFEKAAVNAEGESLADLLDTYMKNCSKDRNIKPFGGGLFENYTYAWTPQEFDMDLLGKKLKEQKEKKEKARKPRKRQEYTPVEMDSGLNTEEGFENDPQPSSPSARGSKETSIKLKSTRDKPLPVPPTSKKPPSPSHSDPASQQKPKKAAPGPPSAKPSKKKQGSVKAGNFAHLQEIASKGMMGHGPPPKSPISPTSSRGGFNQEEEAEAVMEPMYANTANSDSSQNAHTDSGDGYQNWDFSGPPATTKGPPSTTKATPSTTKATAATAAPPPPASSNKTSLKPSTSASAVATADDDNQYQNVRFQTAKTARNNPSKTSPRPPTKSGQSTATKSGQSTAKKQQQQQQPKPRTSTTATSYVDDPEMYQNVNFKTRR